MLSIRRVLLRLKLRSRRRFSTYVQAPNPEGLKKFGPESTAFEVTEGIDLKGKVAFVTGTSDGIGVETTRALLARGATVVGAVRSLEKMSAVANEITSDRDEFEALECDLGDLESVRVCAEKFLEKYSKLDILICNAGVMATDGRRETKDGFEYQLGVNHLGHFLLSAILSPLMLDHESAARLVSLASTGHKRSPIRFNDLQMTQFPYDKWVAYGQAKTANILFASEFNRRAAQRNAHGYSVHPGAIVTSLGRELTDDDRKRFEELDGSVLTWKTPEQGAATSLVAATSPHLNESLRLDGGFYMQDCRIVTSVYDGDPMKYFDSNMTDWALSVDDAKKLWEISEELVGHKFL